MFKVGVTGGIGCGKSTVVEIFNQQYDIPIIDADIIARQVVAKGQPALLEIQRVFGQDVVKHDGELNREKLKSIIFSDAIKKQQLEQILHPSIYQRMTNEVEKQKSAYIILCIPLLFETERNNFVDRTLVIDCSVETQINRVTQRDQLNKEQVFAIISSQVKREYRLTHCDDVIDNSEEITIQQLAEQVKKLHNLYLSLSQNGSFQL